MDLLRNCTSGVHLIDCFQTIIFRVYVLDLDEKEASVGHTKVRNLREAESVLYESASLLSTDFARSELWAFSGKASERNGFSATHTNLTASLDDIITSPSEYGLKLSQQGEIKSAELLAEDVKHHVSPFKPFSLAHIHRHFLAACTKSISRQLTSSGFIPLNIRTFAVRATSRSCWPHLPSWDILSFAIQLSPAGSLRIATRWDDDVGISCLSDFFQEEHISYYYNAPLTVRIAPSGEIALAWPSFSSPKVSFPDLQAQSLPSEIFTVTEKVSWRDSVAHWLASKNIDVHDLHNNQWVNILVSCHDQQFTNSIFGRFTKGSSICVEWPTQLCFIQDKNRKTAPIGQSSFGFNVLDEISWFQQGTGDGFVDPLQSALDWTENQSHREAEAEARHARVAAETEDSGVAQDTSPGSFDWLSPADNRLLTSQEPQMVYPTPSDGLPNQVTPSAISADTNFLSAGGPIDTAMTTMGPMDIEEKPVDSAVGDNTHLMRHSSFGDNDRYGAMTLTDVDFDFFNQPEDIPMDADLPIQDMEIAVDEQGRNVPGLQPIEEANEDVVVRDSDFPTEAMTSVLEGDFPASQGQNHSNGDVAILTHEHAAVPGEQLVQSDAESMPSETLSPLRSPSRQGQLFDDSKYSGGGRFGFGLRNEGRQRTNGPSEAKSMRMKAGQQSSTSIFRNAEKLSQQRQVLGSDDEDSEDEYSMSSSSEPALAFSSQIDRRFGVPFKMSGQLLSTERVVEPMPTDVVETSITNSDVLTSLFKVSPSSWSLAPLLRFNLNRLEQEYQFPNMRPYEKTFSVQLLVRQIVFGPSSFSHFDFHMENRTPLEAKKDNRESNLKRVSKALDGLCSGSFHHEIDLANYLLYDSSEESREKDRTISPIAPRPISLRKAGDSWNLAASAASFWETLGLEPVNGPKNVSAFVVYPWSQAVEESIDYFLQAVKSAWQGHKLGAHEPGTLEDDNHPGHIPVRVGMGHLDSTSHEATYPAYRRSCRNLGARLKNTLKPEDTAVIYMINPFRHKKGLSTLCDIFREVLKAYGSALPPTEQLDAKNIVLQVVPMELVACPNAPVLLDPELTALLAHKVYGFCPTPARSSNSKDLPIPSGASLTLAKAIPRSIRFQMSSTPSSRTLAEWSKIHVAYSESLCGKWVAAAWTDDTGEYQHTAFYSQEGDTDLNGIIEEIWKTTLEIIKPIDVHWRIIVARAGVLPLKEKTTWHDLAAKAVSIHHALCLMSIEPRPFLTVEIKQAVKAALLESSLTMSNVHSTPVTTPHPHQHSSPAPTSPSNPAGSTPSNLLPTDYLGTGDIDAHVQLFDKADESWGFVLPRRLNAANSMLDFNLALASGYLVKRTSIHDEDAPVLIEVNLMHLQEAGKMFTAQQALEELQSARAKRFDNILGEILIMYRNLGLLARLRKLEGKESCTPWHVAVAIKGAEALRNFTVI